MILRPFLLYAIKRWSLLVLCLTSTILAVVFSIMAKENVNEMLDLVGIAPEDLEAKKVGVLNFVI